MDLLTQAFKIYRHHTKRYYQRLTKTLSISVWGVLKSQHQFSEECQTGHILIECDSASHSNKLLKLSDLAGVPVRAALHRTLNSSKGVIKCPDLRHATKDEIIDGLNDQGVTDCFNIKVRDKDGQQHPTNMYILTFNSPITPKQIKIGYIRVKVEIYIPNPLRCFNCQQ